MTALVSRLLFVVVFVLTSTGCLSLGPPIGEPVTPSEPSVQPRLDGRDVQETHPNATLQDSSTVEYWILAYVNHERVESGIEPLIWSPRLAQVADYRSFDMWESTYFSHVDPEGYRYTDHLREFNYSNWNHVAENIYGKGYRIDTSEPASREVAYYDTPKELARALVRGWMHSGSHRWALMHGDYAVTGVGVYGEPDGETTATQLFADREAFDDAVDANQTDEFRAPVADEDPLEDEAAVEPYPEHLGANTPNDR